MPILDRRSPGFAPNNARNSDVAAALVEHVAAIQQQRTQAAVRVQGIQAILYSKLNQGRQCVCHRRNTETERLSPDGKASSGAINRALSGNSNFGISKYSSFNDTDLELDPSEAPTSPNMPNDLWRGDLNIVGGLDIGNNQVENTPVMGDNGQFSPDLDDMFANFDMSTLGFSDISCPICFGTGYVGGYSPFRTWRHVAVPQEMQTAAIFDLPSFELSAGTHSFTVFLPKGAVSVDAFRTMLNTKVTNSKIYVDGAFLGENPVLPFFDGKNHEITLVCTEPITHFEMQTSLSPEPVYFEVPKLTRTADISFLEQHEPFQIMVSPDIPLLQSMDVIAECQLGKMLIVQQSNQWNTKGKQMLGWECTVRVAQPQELWSILPQRRMTSQKRVLGSRPAHLQNLSGMKGFSF